MTPERREQAEKEVREKLPRPLLAGMLLSADEEWDARRKSPAIQLAISQTIALAEAQERIAELEKALESAMIPLKVLNRRSGHLCIVAPNVIQNALESGLAALKGE
jgi:hypothetical protein